MMQFTRHAHQIDARLAWFCGALLSIDAFFIAVFVLHSIYTVLYDGNNRAFSYRWDIAQDGSYAEMFGYVKLAITICLLLSIWRRWKRPIYLALILIFAFVLLDDALRVHERLGRGIADALALQPFAGLRARDFGEMLVWTIVGVPLLAVALAAFVRSPQSDRANGVLLMGAFGLLVLFAIVADMAHEVVRDSFQGANLLFKVIEDGGEQVALTLTCGIAVLIHRELRSREPG